MNLKSPNSYLGLSGRLLPRAVIGAAAAAVLLSGCTEATPQATKTVTAQPTAGGESTGSGTTEAPEHSQEPGASQSPSAQQDAEKHNNGQNNQDDSSNSGQKQEQDNGSNGGQGTQPQPTKSAAAKPQPLIFRVEGACNAIGQELQNWSKGFTPHGSTINVIKQPDGKVYNGLLGGGQGYADGMGHSQWHWKCEAGDPVGAYKGEITDLGSDNTYNTADDRTAYYTFDVNVS